MHRAKRSPHYLSNNRQSQTHDHLYLRDATCERSSVLSEFRARGQMRVILDTGFVWKLKQKTLRLAPWRMAGAKATVPGFDFKPSTRLPDVARTCLSHVATRKTPRARGPRGRPGNRQRLSRPCCRDVVRRAHPPAILNCGDSLRMKGLTTSNNRDAAVLFEKGRNVRQAHAEINNGKATTFLDKPA